MGGLFNNGHIISEDGLNISKRKGMHIGKLTDSYPLVLLNGGGDRNHYQSVTSFCNLSGADQSQFFFLFHSFDDSIYLACLQGLLSTYATSTNDFFFCPDEGTDVILASIIVQPGWGSCE